MASCMRCRDVGFDGAIATIERSIAIDLRLFACLTILQGPACSSGLVDSSQFNDFII